jgi:hypothetical protein
MIGEHCRNNDWKNKLTLFEERLYSEQVSVRLSWV